MADMRKSLSKLKVVELKEKLQELGKTPKGLLIECLFFENCKQTMDSFFDFLGLKADLVNQLAEAYEEQSKGLADTTAPHSAPLQAYQTPPMGEPMMTTEAPESQHYYQQSVGQYSMPGQQVYEQTPNYMQPSYEQQYQYPTHQVFSPPHEQQYNQSTAPYQMTPQLSPRIASQMSPQLSPQMTNPLAPPIQSQITQQLSPQMAAQQYRPTEFQSPHQAFQSNESDAYHTEYGGPTTPEQLSHYGLPHMDIHSIPATQTGGPPSIPSQLVHRPPVMEGFSPEIPQTQALPPNMGQDLSAFKRESEAFIPTHPSMVETEAPTDIIDFDDVSIGMDPTNEVPFNQPIGVFDQTAPEFEIPDASDQYSRDVNDGQAFSHNNQIPLVTEDTNDDTNEESTTDVESDTNQSFPNEEDIKPLESNFSENQDISESSVPLKTETETQLSSEDINPSLSPSTDESPPEMSKLEDNSNDMNSEKESNQFIENFADNESNNEIKMEGIQQIESQQSFDSKDSDESQESNLKTETIPLIVKPEDSSYNLPQEELPPPEEQVVDSVSETPVTQQLLDTQSAQVHEEQRLQTTIEVAEEEPLPSSNEKPFQEEEEKEEELSHKQEPSPKEEPFSKEVPSPSPLISEPQIESNQKLNDLVEPIVIHSNEEKTPKTQNEVPIKQNGFIDSKDIKKLNKNQKKKLRRKLRGLRRESEQKIIAPKVDAENDDRMDIDEEDDEEEIEIE